MIIELRQPLWMQTPYGEALALFLTDYGPDSDHLWTCVQHDAPWTGQLWTWHNSVVRMLANRSLLRGDPMANNMQTNGGVSKSSRKLMMRNKGAQKAAPRVKAKIKKAAKRP